MERNKPMKNWILIGALAAGVLLAGVSTKLQAEGDTKKGAELFRQCAACHSLEPGRHLTGPSLANLWGRKAGTTPGFGRYSEALKKADVTWDEKALDAWLKDPQAFIPGNQMTFPGMKASEAREHMIAYLKTAGATAEGSGDRPQGGGMMGGMGGGSMPDLKNPTPTQQVTAIRHCGDAYAVTLGTGQTFTFWEFNVRFKTDSSKDGPPKGKPAIIRAGMMGDRAFLVFSGPEEISGFIERRC
jgi:cytochrome c